MTVRGALLAWAGLLLLLAATVFLAHVSMGAGNTFASLGIATAKAAVIMLVFMNLWAGRALNRMAAAVLLLWVGIMMALTFTDYVTRPEIRESFDTDPGRRCATLTQRGSGKPVRCLAGRADAQPTHRSTRAMAPAVPDRLASHSP